MLGFTDRALIREVLQDCAPHRPIGLRLVAKKQPAQLPGVKERWKFIEPTIAKAPTVKIVPMIGSLGCPYTCSFCIDADVEYQPLSRDQIQEDLRFLLTKMKRPRVGWHDPNFGVRFDETMSAIEEAVPAGRIDFAAFPSSRSRTCNDSRRTASRPSCLGSSRGTAWATSRRRAGASVSRR